MVYERTMDSTIPGDTPRTPEGGSITPTPITADESSFENWTQMFSVQQAAEQLGIGKTKIYELLDRGEIRSLRIGTARRIPRAAVAEFVFRHLGDMDSSRERDVTPLRDCVDEGHGRTPSRTLGASAGSKE